VVPIVLTLSNPASGRSPRFADAEGFGEACMAAAQRQRTKANRNDESKPRVHKATASSSFCRADGQRRGGGVAPCRFLHLVCANRGRDGSSSRQLHGASVVPELRAARAGLHWRPSKPRFRHAIASPPGSFRPRQPDEPDRRSIAPGDRRGAPAARRHAAVEPASRRAAGSRSQHRDPRPRDPGDRGTGRVEASVGHVRDRRRRRPAEDLVRAGRACPRAALVDADAGDARPRGAARGGRADPARL
jgi:hypothetical protein